MACKVVSAHAEPRQIALAGVAAAAVVLDATASIAAPSASMDASALYKKVEPERASKSRFDGTEVAKLKANDPSITELHFSNKGFGDAEACVLGMVLQVRHKIRVAHHTISTCI